MFDSETLKKFRFLAIATRRAFDGRATGTRRSSQFGAGLEFADFRNYAFGDDFRTIDWNAYARLDALCVNRYQEDSNAPVYCFLDVSASMGRDADDPKFQYAKTVVGALACASLEQFDSVAAYAIDDKLEASFPLARGRESFFALADFLDAQAPRNARTDLAAAVEETLKKIVKPGVAVLVSDCFDSQGLDAALEALLARKCDPIVLQIYAPEEAQPRALGDFELVDAETGERRQIAVDESILRRYQKRFADFLEQTRASCVKRGVRRFATSVDVPFEKFLMQVARNDAKAGR